MQASTQHNTQTTPVGIIGDGRPKSPPLLHTLLWRSLFETGPIDKGLTLSFVSPDIQDGNCVPKVGVEEVQRLTEVWDRALAFYIIGASPSMDGVVRFTNAAWKGIEKPKVQAHVDGYFVVLFQNSLDRDNILQGGPYMMGGKPILLKKWT